MCGYLVGSSTLAWGIAAIIFLLSLTPLLVAVARRLTTGNNANEMDQFRKEGRMKDVINALIEMASNIGCSALSTVLFAEPAAQT